MKVITGIIIIIINPSLCKLGYFIQNAEFFLLAYDYYYYHHYHYHYYYYHYYCQIHHLNMQEVDRLLLHSVSIRKRSNAIVSAVLLYWHISCFTVSRYLINNFSHRLYFSLFETNHELITMKYRACFCIHFQINLHNH